MNRIDYYKARSLSRAINRVCIEAGADLTRFKAGFPLLAEYNGLKDRGVDPFALLSQTRPGTSWTAGMIPRQIHGYDGDNFKRGLRDRWLQRLCHPGSAYQPGPPAGALPGPRLVRK